MIAWLLLASYLLVIAVVCVYGFHRYWMVWRFMRVCRGADPQPERRFDNLPPVTVQLPMFNERRVAERVIEAACRIDYPGHLLEIQVLDDSTDDSADIARRACERMAASGHDVRYLHRTNRDGFKAGALREGLKSAKGEFIAVFDADFVPPPQIIHQTVHYFTDSKVGMVQTRWSHLNRDDSLLTQVQAMFLDGHFVIEQAARSRTGRWFGLNGTAGLWRRSCIEDAGGWQQDTLTEDTDLSYRAQMRGWNFRYVANVCCPAEVPPTVSAFMSQQHRWNKGLIQTAIKLLPRIFASKAPLRTKIEAWFHLTSPLVHLVILLLVLLVAPAMAYTQAMNHVNARASANVPRSVWLLPHGSKLPTELLTPSPVLTKSPRNLFISSPAQAAIGLAFLILGAMAATTFYVASQWAQGLSVWRTVIRLPALMAVGVGISVINSKAVIEAIFRRQSPFVRTPKYNGARESDFDPLVAKRHRRLPRGLIEVVLGCMMLACFLATFLHPPSLVGAPFLLLFAAGYLTIGVPSLRSAIGRASAPEPTPLPQL